MHRAGKEKTESRFCVVSFPDEEESLYIVSSKWLEHDSLNKQYVCLWPPYKSDARIKRAVLTEEMPLSTWHSCPAKLIQKCKSYKNAENILNAIETISNERSRILHGIDWEANSYNPATKKIKIEHEESLSGVEICDQPSDSSSEEDSSGGILYEVSDIKTAGQSPCSTTSGVAGNTSIATTSTYHFLLDPTPVAEEEMTSTMEEGSYSNCESLEEKMDFFAKILESLKKTVEQNSEILKSLYQDSNDYCPIDTNILPIKTIEDLVSLNEKLKDEKEFAYFAKQLGYLGGRDHSDAVRRILSRLILNDVAVCCNWIGGYGKTSFREFKRILQLVFVAVRQNKEYSNTSQASVENSAKRWLRCAGDRNGEIEPLGQSLPACAVPSTTYALELDKVLKIVVEIREQNTQILQWIKLQDKKDELAVSRIPVELPVTLPLTSQNEFQVLERFLEDTQNFANLCTYLSSRVGKGVTRAVNGCLRHVMTDQLACGYNFKGTNQKTSFGSTLLCCVLLRAVKKANGSTDDEIHRAMKIWLKHAPQRHTNSLAKKH